MSKTEKPKCVGMKWDGWHNRLCGLTATTEYDGKPYCKIHNPAIKAEKERRRNEKWDRERAERNSRWEKQEAQRKEQERKAEAYQPLYDALQHAKESIKNRGPFTAVLMIEIDKALEAGKPIG
jgi:uncharacterized Zn finger protein (UPF0148 family)